MKSLNLLLLLAICATAFAHSECVFRLFVFRSSFVDFFEWIGCVEWCSARFMQFLLCGFIFLPELVIFVPFPCSEEESTEGMSPPPAEWKIWLYSILGAFASVAVSTVGAVVFYFFPGAICRWRMELLSLSAGAMVGTSFFVLLPEIAEEYELGDDKGIQWMIVGGVLLGLAIDHIIQIFGGHGHPHERPVTPSPAGLSCSS